MPEAAKTILIGINGKLYYGPAGVTAATECKNCRDVQLKLGWQTAEVTYRGGGAVELSVNTVKTVEISWKMLNIKNDPDLAAVRSAFLSGKPIALKDLDEEAGFGPDGDFIISQFDLVKGEKGAQEYQVAAKPTIGRALVIPDPAAGGE